MFNSRTIPEEIWAQARQLLIFYFSRRLGVQNAEDLAHKTLLAIWTREDYEFVREDDFLKVCHGFARRILREAYREHSSKYSQVELKSDLEEKIFGVKGLKGPEASAFLDQVKRCGEKILEPQEWRLIESAIKRTEDDEPASGKVRIKLHRVRKKLAEITGWTKKQANGESEV